MDMNKFKRSIFSLFSRISGLLKRQPEKPVESNVEVHGYPKKNQSQELNESKITVPEQLQNSQSSKPIELESIDVHEHPQMRHRRLASEYLESDRYEEAVPLLEKILQSVKEVYGNNQKIYDIHRSPMEQYLPSQAGNIDELNIALEMVKNGNYELAAYHLEKNIFSHLLYFDLGQYTLANSFLLLATYYQNLEQDEEAKILSAISANINLLWDLQPEITQVQAILGLAYLKADSIDKARKVHLA
ncbi:MAG: hypothetical protein GY705_20590 [Bacteroidetes bacterium]|nr:hypothetical protein [Bacteroidota bacterium]